MQLSHKPKLLFVVIEDYYFCSHRLSLAKAAQREGYEVHLATRVQDHGAIIEKEGIFLHPIPFKRSGMNPIKETKAVSALQKLYKQIKPEIIHNIALKPALYGTMAALGIDKKPKIVNLLTGLGHLFTSQKWHMKILANSILLCFRFLFSRFNTEVIVQNKDDYNFFLKKKISTASHLHLILGSGIDTKHYPETPDPEGTPIALFVARILRDKGIFELIEAAKILKSQNIPVEIHLVGSPDPQNPSSATKEDITSWASQGLVTWHGHQTNIAPFWEQSHIAILPSYREGLPKSLLEAASAGRPIVSTDVPGCREICIPGINGILVPAKDPKELAEAIKKLALSRELRQKMGALSRKLVEDKFTIDSVNKQTLQVYKST